MKVRYLALITLLAVMNACSTGRKNTKIARTQTIATKTTQTTRTSDSICFSKFMSVVYDNPRIEVTRVAPGDTVRVTLHATKATLSDLTDVKTTSMTTDSVVLKIEAADTALEERKSSPGSRLPAIMTCLLSVLLIVLSWRGIRSRR